MTDEQPKNGLDAVEHVDELVVKLRCPHCSSSRVHISKVELFIRERKKDKLGSTYEWDEHSALSVWARTEMNGSPSPDKNGLIIRLWCDKCSHMPKIEFYEFEGSFYICGKKKYYSWMPE